MKKIIFLVLLLMVSYGSEVQSAPDNTAEVSSARISLVKEKLKRLNTLILKAAVVGAVGFIAYRYYLSELDIITCVQHPGTTFKIGSDSLTIPGFDFCLGVGPNASKFIQFMNELNGSIDGWKDWLSNLGRDYQA